MKRRLFVPVLLLTWAVTAAAQDDPLKPSAYYDPVIPTVESVLGYRVGEAFTPYADLERFYKTLAASSERLRLEPYGKSVEGRTLYLLIVSTPENLARLEAIRAATAKLADPRATPPAEAQSLAASTPVVVWLSYNVHGNEAVSSEAAMQVAYELAASQDPRVLDWLQHAIILIDPILNPDGRERYVQFFRSTLGKNPNPDRFAAEHQERWPGGRTNHYLFDLNRDWAWQTQPESRARIAAYRQWNPQVHVDFHEMGAEATYYFAPPAEPIHETVAPLLRMWFDIYGRGNAAAFDRLGFRYYTREDFDLFYPSYGDSWPSLNGAIGMTYEQAGGPAGGLVLELREGQRTLTLRDRAARHFTSSLATIDTSVKNREARLGDFYDFHRAAIDAGSKGPVRQFIIPGGQDPDRLAHMIGILVRQGIEVQYAENFEADNLTNSWGEKVARKHFPQAWIVDLAQPAGFLARAQLEREARLETTFFYDVTAWSLPLAMGLETYASPRPVAAALRPQPMPPEYHRGGVDGTEQGAAYVFSWDSGCAARLLGYLLAEGIKSYVSLKPFKVGGRSYADSYSAGSIIVPAEGNPPNLRARLDELAQRTTCPVYPLPTLRSDEGIDLGSNRVRFLRRPRVAVLTDTPTSPNDYGALWHYFEHDLDLPFTPLRVETLRNVDLRQYNVLILPSDFGDGRGYPRFIDKQLQQRLADWVRAGGVLIGLRGGAVFATKEKAGLASVTYRYVRREDEEARLEEERAAEKEKPDQKLPEKKEEKAEEDLERKLMPYAEREKAQREEEIPGTILSATLDTTHPLGFGLESRLAVLNNTAPILELSESGENVAYFPREKIKLSGFLMPENEKKLAQTAYLVRERQGQGFVILFADSPVFRGFWDSTARLLANAIFFGNVSNPYSE
ncbi:MAG TPA: M14 family metallopeptidase [Candidatus Xenobia bacterium]|nr:M14 family metallopeptidase [Candidatus Xenobia bacterium]